MSDVEAVVEAVAAVSPESVASEVAVAAVETLENPSVENIVKDVELLTKVVEELKAKIAATHPSLLDLLKSLF